MGTTTAVFLFFILFGLSYQQDQVDIGTGCSEDINSLNSACLSNFNVDPANSDFCSNAYGLSQCLDASCLETKYRDAIHSFVPPLFRPGSCPICSTVPTQVTESRKTCSVWGIYHTIDFDSNVMLCPRLNSTILLTNEYFTITALTNTTVDDRVVSGILYPGITGIRLDYHGCAVYSKTWFSKDDWDARRIPAQGWFPHLITITQNTTEAAINLLAVNTDLIIRKSGRYMSISIRTGLADVSQGICTQNNTCVAEETVVGYPALVSYTACSGLPEEFQLGCQYDLDNSNNTSNLGLTALDASISIARVNAKPDIDNFATIDAREVAMPVVLTVVSTGIMAIIFCLVLAVKCRSDPKRVGGASFILLFIGWVIFVLNTHILGFVYPFTGLMFISMALNIAVLVAVWLLTSDFQGRSRLAAVNRAYKAFIIIILPQQFCIAVIGAAANEWFLWEVQFWWGIASLVFMLFAGAFLAVNIWALAWRAPEKPAKERRPREDVAPQNMFAMEAPIDRVDAPRHSRSASASSSSSTTPAEVKAAWTKDNDVTVQPSHVVDPVHVIAQPNVVDVDVRPEPQHVVQPSHVIVPPPQEHVIVPQPQSHVIESQPMYYGNATDAPPPPKDGGAFSSPSPMDVYQNPGKYMADQESSVDPARHMLKRAIKLAGVNVDGAKEAQIYAKMMELLQTYNLTGVINRDDGEAATLRNNLATDLSEEIKLYQTDSLDELSYGLKEAILLWKEDYHL